MEKQQEDALLRAFRAMHKEEKEMLLGLAIARAAKNKGSKPHLQLVATELDPPGLPRLRGLPG